MARLLGLAMWDCAGSCFNTGKINAAEREDVITGDILIIVNAVSLHHLFYYC